MSKRTKWTIETVKEKCGEHGIECLEKEYINAKTKMRFKCKCGNEYEAKWDKVTNRNQWQCLECNGKIKWTIETVKEKCGEHGIECLEKEYVNNYTKMRFRCKCGNEYEVKWSSVTSGNQWQCRECSNKKLATKFKLDLKEIKKECLKYGIECLEEEYINVKTKMRFRCECGNEYEANWGNVAGRGQWQCPECSGKAKWIIEEIKRICREHGIECLEKEYVNNATKMRFKCKCGNEYEARWGTVTGYSQWQCPKCGSKMSKGEIITSEFLSNLLKDENLFEEQKTFEDLADKNLLSYDFFIPEFNILIEIQGEQHYKPVEMFGGEKQFKRQQHHDKLKREYAEQNGFTLIEIPWGCNGIDTEEKLIEELKNKLSGLIK